MMKSSIRFISSCMTEPKPTDLGSMSSTDTKALEEMKRLSANLPAAQTMLKNSARTPERAA
jgi:hypothetical protein